MDDLGQFLPRRYIDFYASLSDADLKGVDIGPLPRVAIHHYLTGGCYILARALAELSGFLLAATLNEDGEPSHAFVVDEHDVIDAQGRRPLALLGRGGVTRIGMTWTELSALIETTPNARLLFADMAEKDSRDMAFEAARVLLEAPGPFEAV